MTEWVLQAGVNAAAFAFVYWIGGKVGRLAYAAGVEAERDRVKARFEELKAKGGK